ncbi:PREDICTED: uncharacterized protein LOC105456307 [Wasmannia auropunctata]|uniref:uncharacterized protein LOC105456307 n=1 Tax=Wasmannia auropunctata TaxID=64793 RepID=UPI0005F09F67|nr:PREDICTED: uncharacterized protein LOC105456307 [Wasmannia auropunctata]
MYCVAEFTETAETEVIPIRWINKEETRCFWPDHYKSDRVKKAILCIESPNPEKWSKYSLRILHKYNSYQEACSHLSKAVYTSHLDSEEDLENECRSKRKTRSKIYASNEESEEENLVSKKVRHDKNKSKIGSLGLFEKCSSGRENLMLLNSVAESSYEKNFAEKENFNSSIIPTISTNNNNKR